MAKAWRNLWKLVFSSTSGILGIKLRSSDLAATCLPVESSRHLCLLLKLPPVPQISITTFERSLKISHHLTSATLQLKTYPHHSTMIVMIIPRMDCVRLCECLNKLNHRTVCLQGKSESDPRGAVSAHNLFSKLGDHPGRQLQALPPSPLLYSWLPPFSSQWCVCMGGVQQGDQRRAPVPTEFLGEWGGGNFAMSPGPWSSTFKELFSNSWCQEIRLF